MALGLRRKVDLISSYGDSPQEISVEVHHGGFFIGFGHLRSYVDGKRNKKLIYLLQTTQQEPEMVQPVLEEELPIS
ncbi:hypothetical protein C2845_PM11G05290 [Panicum miliaceum]|uniref:Uncharacterized protein n=1 Tax=Panicum miliaceum TaxID=4540 RepID=A0A3L6RSS4_PANMI|nr:hypothetical protein C2845_PM11G05290 [Panicum miliaceum]